MNTPLRRGLIIVGVSTLVGVAFTPLGDSDWASGIRTGRVEQPAQDPDHEPTAPSRALRIVAPVVKEVVLMGVPAGLVILLSMGVRRFT